MEKCWGGPTHSVDLVSSWSGPPTSSPKTIPPQPALPYIVARVGQLFWTHLGDGCGQISWAHAIGGSYPRSHRWGVEPARWSPSLHWCTGAIMLWQVRGRASSVMPSDINLASGCSTDHRHPHSLWGRKPFILYWSYIRSNVQYIMIWCTS